MKLLSLASSTTTTGTPEASSGTVRSDLFKNLKNYYGNRKGRRPIVYATVDLTSIEKRGEFKALPIHPYARLRIHVLDGPCRRQGAILGSAKDGLHLVVLYLVIGSVHFPYGFKVWRGKGTASPSELALKLLRSLPMQALTVLGRAKDGIG